MIQLQINIYPNDTTTNFVLYNYVVIDKLSKDYSFLHSVNQRKLAIHLTLNVLTDYEFLFNVDTSDEDQRVWNNRKNVYQVLGKCSLK